MRCRTLNYIGFQPTGDNQFGGFRAGDDVVLNGTTYHVWALQPLTLRKYLRSHLVRV